MYRSNKKQSGFFLIEVVVATALAATVVIFLLGLVQDTVEISQRSLEKTQAGYLLEEGAEAVKTIRDAGWVNISSVSNGVDEYLAWNGSRWDFSNVNSMTDSFTRVVSLEPVYRDGNDDITISGGTLDTHTRKVTVTVSWTATTGVQVESLTFYLVDIRS